MAHGRCKLFATPSMIPHNSPMEVRPIAYMHCNAQYPYDTARQGSLVHNTLGELHFEKGQNFEQALEDLEGFSHCWLIYQFHHNDNWKPKVNPPRGEKKVGVFASRAPYRPNPIGLSCVKLEGVDGLKVTVSGHDLLDGTPILDIKPYIPYADVVPEANAGWLEALEGQAWDIQISEVAREQLDWLMKQGVDRLEDFIVQQLGDEPLNHKRKRLQQLDDKHWDIAYRTWRIRFEVAAPETALTVTIIHSGYSPEDMESKEDPYADKAIHRAYCAQFGE